MPPPEQAGPTLISTDLLLAEVIGSTATLAQIAATADPASQVPTCPDWTLRQLVTQHGDGKDTAYWHTQVAQP